MSSVLGLLRASVAPAEFPDLCAVLGTALIAQIQDLQVEVSLWEDIHRDLDAIHSAESRSRLQLSSFMWSHKASFQRETATQKIAMLVDQLEKIPGSLLNGREKMIVDYALREESCRTGSSSRPSTAASTFAAAKSRASTPATNIVQSLRKLSIKSELSQSEIEFQASVAELR